MPNLFVPMIFAWLNFWRTCFSVSPSMYINPFMFPICPGVILSELSSSLRSNSLGVFDKQFRDCFRCVFSIAIRISLVPYTKPINIKKAEGHSPIRKRWSPSPIHTNRGSVVILGGLSLVNSLHAYTFASLKRKKLISTTPLNDALNALILALNASAAAFVLLFTKKFRILS